MTKRTANGVQTVTIWDLPTRLFHWLLVLLIALSWLSGDIGGLGFSAPLPWGGSLFLSNMDVHMLLGQTILALVLYRVIWGLIGSSTARFASFLRGPAAIIGYLRRVIAGDVPAAKGHNPVGGLMIVFLLALLAVQAGTGLFANDDIFSEGPLAKLVGKSMSDTLTEVHDLSFGILIGLVAVHIGAAVYYLVRGKNLVRPMVTGRTPVDHLPEDDRTAPHIAPAWRAMIAFAISAAAVWGLVQI